MESDTFRNIENGILGTAEQLAGAGNPDGIELFKRTSPHGIVKNTTKMCRTQSAQIGKRLHRKLIHVVAFYVFKRGNNRKRMILILAAGAFPHGVYAGF